MDFSKIFESLVSVHTRSNGSYIARKLDFTSRQLIGILQKELGLGQNSVKEEDLHCTLMYSYDEARFPFSPDKKSINSEIGKDARLEWFGENKDSLVLSFGCPKLKARHLEIASFYNLRHTYNPYRSHVTLAYNVKNPLSIDLTKGIIPAYLKFVDEYYNDLDLDWVEKKKRA